MSESLRKTKLILGISAFCMLGSFCPAAAQTATTTAANVARYAYSLEYSEYTNGLLVAYSMNPATGRLRALETIQLPSENYGITVHPSSKFLYIPDGQEIIAYKIGTNGFLQPVTGSPFNLPGGSALRFTPSGAFGYSNTGAEYSVNKTTGALTQIGTATVGHIPYDAALSPSGGFLYIPNFSDATISAFTVDQTTGALTAIAGSPFADGDIDPAAAVVSPNGKFLFVANFSANNSGSISVFSIGAATGILTPITGSPFSGSGPANGIAIDRTGKFLYVGANGVDAYQVNQTTGALTAISGSPYTTPAAPYGVSVDPTGKFLYASIFGNLQTTQTAPDLIIYSINATTGALTQVTTQGVDGNQGELLAISTGPKAVTYTPKFAYVANQFDSTISEYSINDSSGALTAISGSPIQDKNGPFSVVAAPSGAFVYTANATTNPLKYSISEYKVNATTGALTLISGSPITGFGSLGSLVVDPTSSYLFALDDVNGVIDTYAINTKTGALTPFSNVSIPDRLSREIGLDPTGIVMGLLRENAIDCYRVNNGTLTPLTAGTSANQTLGFGQDQSSQYIFVTDLKTNTIQTYSMPTLKLLSSASTGNAPGDPVAEPSGKYIYVPNGNDGTVSSYSLNSATGVLTQIGTAVSAGAGIDSLTISSDGKFLYTANSTAGTVSIFAIKSNGMLTASGTTTTGTHPSSIAVTGIIQ